jgi:hypothetical protein
MKKEEKAKNAALAIANVFAICVASLLASGILCKYLNVTSFLGKIFYWLVIDRIFTEINKRIFRDKDDNDQDAETFTDF